MFARIVLPDVHINVVCTRLDIGTVRNDNLMPTRRSSIEFERLSLSVPKRRKTDGPTCTMIDGDAKNLVV